MIHIRFLDFWKGMTLSALDIDIKEPYCDRPIDWMMGTGAEWPDICIN